MLATVVIEASAMVPTNSPQVQSIPGCLKMLLKNYSQPFCPDAKDIPSLDPIPPVVPQPNYTYTTCMEFYDAMAMLQRWEVKSAADWCHGGSYFNFRSGAARNVEVSGGGLKMWWRCDGAPDAPQVLFVHGYPTSSFDTWRAASDLLKTDHYVCHVDHQGMGFSDKPRAPYYYSIYEHAAALHHFVTRVANLSAFHMVTHDMGDSIGFAFLEKFVNPATAIVQPTFSLTHHTITNGNVWLPLSSLTPFQLGLLDNHTSSEIEKECLSSPSVFALMIEHLYGTSIGDRLAEHAPIASVFEYQDGTQNQNDLDQYLQQRACFETNWLSALNTSAVPATIVWGQGDPVAPMRVAQFVWDATLSLRTSARARFIKSPHGGHYIPHDQPDLYACLVRSPTGNCTMHDAYEAGSTFPPSGSRPTALRMI